MDAINHKDFIAYFSNKLRVLIVLHQEGKTYCLGRSVWREQNLYSNRVYYSPQLWEKMINHQNLEISFYDDLYYLMIETYVEITGYTPPPYFRMNMAWEKKLVRCLASCDEKKIRAIVSLYLKCTSINGKQIIESMEDLVEMKEYHEIMEERYIHPPEQFEYLTKSNTELKEIGKNG